MQTFALFKIMTIFIASKKSFLVILKCYYEKNVTYFYAVWADGICPTD